MNGGFTAVIRSQAIFSPSILSWQYNHLKTSNFSSRFSARQPSFVMHKINVDWITCARALSQPSPNWKKIFVSEFLTLLKFLRTGLPNEQKIKSQTLICRGFMETA